MGTRKLVIRLAGIAVAAVFIMQCLDGVKAESDTGGTDKNGSTEISASASPPVSAEPTAELSPSPTPSYQQVLNNYRGTNAKLVLKDGEIVIKEYKGSGAFRSLYNGDTKTTEKTFNEESRPVWEKSDIVLPGYHKAGYTFTGWQDMTDNLVYKEGSTYSFEENSILNALFDANVYSVVIPSVGEYSVRYGEEVASLPKPSDSVRFINWGEELDPQSAFDGYYYGGTKYFDENGQCCKEWDIDHGCTLEIRWKDIEEPTPTRTGYTFLGWSTDRESSIPCSVSGPGVYYAIYKPNQHKLVIGSTSRVVEYGEFYDGITVPVKFGYLFNGAFFDNGNISTRVFDEFGNSNGVWLWDHDVSVYYSWTRILPTIDYERTGVIGDKFVINVDDGVKDIAVENSCVSANKGNRTIEVTCKKYGTARVLFKTGTHWEQISIKSMKIPESIKFKKKKITLSSYTTKLMKPTLSSGSYSKSYSIKSSNTKVATMSSDFTVFAKKKGKATITVTTYNGKKCKLKVVVKK